MDKKIPVLVSARHLHLTQDVVDILFGKGHQLEPKVPTKGQFLSTTRVKVVGPKTTMENVAIMGPCRNFNQFEISMTDTRTLGIPAPIRMSGDIEGTPGVKLIGTVGEIELDKGVIVAKRHIHLSKESAEELGVTDGECVMLRVESDDRALIFDDTIARVGGPETVMHIDTDEGNAACVVKGTVGTIIKK
jgi:Propanediol utilization protein